MTGQVPAQAQVLSENWESIFTARARVWQNAQKNVELRTYVACMVEMMIIFIYLHPYTCKKSIPSGKDTCRQSRLIKLNLIWIHYLFALIVVKEGGLRVSNGQQKCCGFLFLTEQVMTQTFLGFCLSQLCMFLHTANRLWRLGAWREGQLHSDTWDMKDERDPERCTGKKEPLRYMGKNNESQAFRNNTAAEQQLLWCNCHFSHKLNEVKHAHGNLNQRVSVFYLQRSMTINPHPN